MSLSLKQRKFTEMIGRFIIAATGMNYELTLGHAWRDTETQKRLVERGLSWTMKSKHLDRLAVDFNLFIAGNYIREDAELWRPLGELWERLGGYWGGRMGLERKDYEKVIGKDPGHFAYEE